MNTNRGGRGVGRSAVPNRLVKRVFTAAAMLYELAPWKRLCDTDRLRVDIPAFDLKGGVISVVGNDESMFGFLFFRSRHEADCFLQACLRGLGTDDILDYGTSFLGLRYESIQRVSPETRAGFEESGLMLSGSNLFPSVERRNRHGMPTGFAPDDIELIASCTEGLATYFALTGELLQSNQNTSGTRNLLDADGGIVLITYPWSDGDLLRSMSQSRKPPKKRSTSKKKKH